ncbi:MAG: hypothetical protein OCC45_08600 [Desulfotalea sp.]
MEKITINIFINSSDELTISVPDKENVNINITDDVDLSGYVSTLTRLIDNNVQISLNKSESDDPKINLIQDTLENITKSFNDSVTESQTPDTGE